LEAAGRACISPDVTFHSLRRTYASLLAEGGADSGFTKSQIGHKSAKLTLEVYTDAGNRRHAANDQVGTLLRTPDWAQKGTKTLDTADGDSNGSEPGEAESREVAGDTT
jgi:integrase